MKKNNYFLKTRFCISLFLIFNISVSAQISQLRGKWNTGRENTIINIQNNGADYKGLIVSSDNPKAKIGSSVVKEVKEKGSQIIGMVYAPKRKEWYDAVFVPNGNTIEVKVRVGFLTKTIVWKKHVS